MSPSGSQAAALPAGILVDTSVLLAYQRSCSADLTDYIDRMRRVVPVCITPVLEGEYKFAARGMAEWAVLHGLCAAFRDIPLTVALGREAVSIIDDLGTDAHMFGAVQVTDALTAAAALAHGLEIVHNDRDFEHVTKVRPALRQRRFRL